MFIVSVFLPCVLLALGAPLFLTITLHPVLPFLKTLKERAKYLESGAQVNLCLVGKKKKKEKHLGGDVSTQTLPC